MTLLTSNNQQQSQLSQSHLQQQQQQQQQTNSSQLLNAKCQVKQNSDNLISDRMNSSSSNYSNVNLSKLQGSGPIPAPLLKNLDALKLNSPLLIGHNNLVPRRPAYSTSKVPSNTSSLLNSREQSKQNSYLISKFDAANPSINQTTTNSCRLIDKQNSNNRSIGLGTVNGCSTGGGGGGGSGSHSKNTNLMISNNLIRSTHFNSSESLSMAGSHQNSYNHQINNNNNFLNNSYKLNMNHDLTENNLLFRKSAFQVINPSNNNLNSKSCSSSSSSSTSSSTSSSSSSTSSSTSSSSSSSTQNHKLNLIDSLGNKNVENLLISQQQQQQQPTGQLVAAVATTTASSSIASSVSSTSTSACLSSSNSASNSLSSTTSSRSSNEVKNSSNLNLNLINQNNLIIEREAENAIRSGSVSSARSIYELRLKSLSETMPIQSTNIMPSSNMTTTTATILASNQTQLKLGQQQQQQQIQQLQQSQVPAQLQQPQQQPQQQQQARTRLKSNLIQATTNNLNKIENLRKNQLNEMIFAKSSQRIKSVQQQQHQQRRDSDLDSSSQYFFSNSKTNFSDLTNLNDDMCTPSKLSSASGLSSANNNRRSSTSSKVLHQVQVTPRNSTSSAVAYIDGVQDEPPSSSSKTRHYLSESAQRRLSYHNYYDYNNCPTSTNPTYRNAPNMQNPQNQQQHHHQAQSHLVHHLSTNGHHQIQQQLQHPNNINHHSSTKYLNRASHCYENTIDDDNMVIGLDDNVDLDYGDDDIFVEDDQNQNENLNKHFQNGSCSSASKIISGGESNENNINNDNDNNNNINVNNISPNTSASTSSSSLSLSTAPISSDSKSANNRSIEKNMMVEPLLFQHHHSSHHPPHHHHPHHVNHQNHYSSKQATTTNGPSTTSTTSSGNSVSYLSTPDLIKAKLKDSISCSSSSNKTNNYNPNSNNINTKNIPSTSSAILSTSSSSSSHLVKQQFKQNNILNDLLVEPTPPISKSKLINEQEINFISNKVKSIDKQRAYLMRNVQLLSQSDSTTQANLIPLKQQHSLASPPPPPLPPPLPSTSQSSILANSNNQINYSIMSSLANFSHFDIQSVLFNYESIKLTKDTLNVSINMRTGASAASRQSSLENLNKTMPITGTSSKSQHTSANGITAQASSKTSSSSSSSSSGSSSSSKHIGAINSISSVLGSLESHSSSIDENSIAGEMKMAFGSSNSSSENNSQILKQQQQQAESFLDEKTSLKNRLSSSLFVYLNDDEKKSEDSLMKIQKANDAINTNLKRQLKTEICRSNGDQLELKCLDLVEECSFFKLELGGDIFKGLGLVEEVSQRRMMKLNSISILDKMNAFYKKEIIDLIESNNNEPFTIEFQDWGAFFYRYLFINQDHSNYIGVDRDIGPVAISLKREKIQVETNAHSHRSNSSNTNTINYFINNERAYEYGYRFIFRTSGLNSLRGTILEEHINSKGSAGGSKGLPHRDIISHLLPELDLSCLRLADPKLNDKLMELDEQYIMKTHKIGVLLCKAGQSTEEEMYNNKDSTPAFDEFLQLLGEKITLKGFANYRGVLDNTNDTTGTHSVYTKFRDKEIMFHVSTLLPFSNNDRQQLTRKRHIGNDLVTIVFQEPGSLPFSPKTIRSHFQHVFIVVRAINPNTINTQYSVAISYSQDVPSFGPPLPKNPLFVKSKEFREFLLAKIVNADNAGMKSEKFTHIRMRTRQCALNEFALNYSTKTTLENCGYNGNMNGMSHKFVFFNFGSIKQKKTRSKSLQMFNSITNENDDSISISLLGLNGAIFWTIQAIEDFQYSLENCCYLGISKQYIVVIDAKRKSVVLLIGCNAVIGWSLNENEANLVLYFDQGECVCIRLKSRYELFQVIKRLEYFTKGCKTIELSLEKKDYGQLGFSIHHDGVVTEVEPYSLAYYRGLKQGTRIVKIGDYYVINLDHEKMIDLLRKSSCLKVTFLPPLEDGSARRGQDDSYALYAYLSTCSSLNERLIDSIKTPSPQNLKSISRINRNSQCYQNQQPFISSTSPTKHRRVANSINGVKLAERLSSTSAINSSNICNGSLISSNEIVNNTNHHKQHNNTITAYTNSLYLGYDHLAQADLKENLKPNQINQIDYLNSQQNEESIKKKNRDQLASESKLNSSPTNPSIKLPSTATITSNTNGGGFYKGSNPSSNSEWTKMILAATKDFENVHRSSDNVFISDYRANKPQPPAVSSSNYISTDEIILSDPEFVKAQMLAANKDKTISVDELKDIFVQLQMELNQEKLEKFQFSSKIAYILEENINLKQELFKLKDENNKLNNKLMFQTIYTNNKTSDNVFSPVLKLNNLNDSQSINTQELELISDSNI